jgi:hypothetical protein
MSLNEVLGVVAAILTLIGTPVGFLFRQHLKDDEAERFALLAAHERALAALQTAHDRELAARDREVADRDRRLELANVTESRLIEMALRSTQAGEKAADAAITVTRGKP